MRISALAQATGVSVATLKFYLRQGLLPPGEALSRTQADYGEEHVERVRLIRALTGPGQLSLTATGRALDAIDGSRLDVMRQAHLALYPEEPEPGPEPTAAHSLLERLGWLVEPDHPAVAELDAALTALADARVDAVHHVDRYAAAMHDVAQIDIGHIPADPAMAVREVVLGTVLLDPVLQALRRVAQQDVARRQEQGADATGGRGKLDG